MFFVSHFIKFIIMLNAVNILYVLNSKLSFLKGPSNQGAPLVVKSPLSSPVATQTSSILSSRIPRKTKLRLQVRHLRKQNKKQLSNLEIEDFNRMCDRFLTDPLAAIIKSHVQMKSKKPISRRYSLELKQFALALYFLSPRAYRYLAKILTLPNKRTLERLTSKLSCQPGLNNDAIFKALEIKIKSMIEKERHCIICIDEMAIKSNLFF